MDKDKLHEDNGGGSGLGEFNGPSRRSQETADRLGRVVAKNYDDPKTQIIEGRPLADLVDLDDSERVYGFLSDYWERLGPKLKWELLVAVKKSYAETFGSYKISPFDFVELAESEDWADVDKLRGLADPMATEGNGDGSPQYTIKEIALDAAYVTILKQKDKNEVGFGSIAEDKVLEWIYMDDWFGLFGAASSEDDCFGVKESGPVDDRFNHTDGYFVVKNQHTKNRPLCIAFDITIDPEAVKGKMLEKHCYWFKSEFAQGSNLSEGGYKKETRYVSHSHKHRAGLWLPGFVAAKYFIGFRDEENDAEVSPGKKLIMPKLVIGCDGDTIGEILQLESQKKKSLLRLRKQSINDITDNDIAKINNDITEIDKGIKERKAKLQAQAIAQCKQQAGLIVGMIEECRKQWASELNNNVGSSGWREMFGLAGEQAKMMKEYFDGVYEWGKEKAKSAEDKSFSWGWSMVDSDITRQVKEVASGVYHDEFRPSAIPTDEDVVPWGVAEFKSE